MYVLWKLPAFLKPNLKIQSCGQDLFDDFVELRPGALKALEDRLNQGNKHSVQQHSRGTFEGNTAWTLSGLQSRIATCFRGILIPSSEPSDSNDRLPVHNPHSDSKISQPSRPKQPSHILYILFCIDNDKNGTKLQHERVEHIQSDRPLFLLLREVYSRKRNVLRSMLSMRTVKSVNLVKVRCGISLVFQFYTFRRSIFLMVISLLQI